MKRRLILIETPMIQTDKHDVSLATTARGTKFTTESGENLPEIKSATVHLAYDKAITADIKLHCAFRGAALANYFIKDPRTGDDKLVSSITWDDGSVWNA